MILIFGSCSKTNHDLVNSGTESAINEAFFNDIADQFYSAQAKIEGGSSITFQGKCATISISPLDSTTWPKTITIDFGTTGCSDLRGNIHKGQLICVLNKPWKQMGSKVEITPNNYSVNDFEISGKKIISNLGRNNLGQRMDSVQVRQAVITYPDGSTATWESDRVRTMIAGEQTSFPLYSDDVYLINGIGSGINKKGQVYSVYTSKDLQIALNCRWIQTGSMVLKNNSSDSISIDYGNTGCDANATLDFRGKIYQITLK